MIKVINTPIRSRCSYVMIDIATGEECRLTRWFNSEEEAQEWYDVWHSFWCAKEHGV